MKEDSMTKQKLETLIVRTLAELQLRGHIVNTVDIDDELGILCSVVSLQSGTRHVFMDLFQNQDDGSVVDEIKHQLTLGLN
jgi:hypothetical protein